MKTIKIVSLLFMVLLYTKISTAQESEHIIKVTITNIASNNGTIQVGLYNNQNNFLHKTFTSTSINAKVGSTQVVFKNIPKGEYAISLYHDVDNNKELNTMLGIPTEPYGTSNNAKGIFGPPKWEDAKFTMTDKETVQSITL